MKRFQAVIGAAMGDEGKGLVSRWLAKQAFEHKEKTLTVFFSGGCQRAHTTVEGVFHTLPAGLFFGSDILYSEMFVIDPIAIYLEYETWKQSFGPFIEPKLYVSPHCRVVTPFDVWNNRLKETCRGVQKHGSCGMGIFETVFRDKSLFELKAKDLSNPWKLWEQLKKIEELYSNSCSDMVYNAHNFMKAAEWFTKNVEQFETYEVLKKYDTIIFEGSQGLLLSQTNMDFFPYLTPASTGVNNIEHWFNLGAAEEKEIYYVSRSYMTRHGAGPFPTECKKKDINPAIVDSTNIPNKWQNSLRFGYYDVNLIGDAIVKDTCRITNNKVKFNMVFTQLNYTNGKVRCGKNDDLDINNDLFYFLNFDHLYGSWDKENIERIM